MNAAHAFLRERWTRLELDRFGDRRRMRSLVVTPGFRTSAHVVFLVWTSGDDAPTLVLKVARRPGAAASLEREAANLRAVHRSWAGASGTVPRLVALDRWEGRAALLQTALAGREMTPRMVRRRPHACSDAVIGWVASLHGATCERATGRGADLEQLAERPLERLRSDFPFARHEADLVDRADGCLRRLRSTDLPAVFEHGDLCAPNILMSLDGDLGVVDWELGTPRGMPGHDLFFVLAFLSFARARVRSESGRIDAFDRAFFGRRATTGAAVRAYAGELGLHDDLVAPLFVACWTRYLARLLDRSSGPATPGGDDERKHWLRNSRYFALWRHAVQNVDRLGIAPTREVGPTRNVRSEVRR